MAYLRACLSMPRDIETSWLHKYLGVEPVTVFCDVLTGQEFQHFDEESL